MNITRTNDTLRLPASRHPVPTSTRIRTRRIPLLGYIAVLLALPIVVIAGAHATGWWVTDGHTVPTTALGADTIGTNPTTGSGQDSATIANPADIKGSMTVQQVLDAFPGVTAADIHQQFGVPADTPTSTQLKELAENGNGYEVTNLREWLQSRQSAG